MIGMDEKTVEVWTDCRQCGNRLALRLAAGVAADDMLREANLRLAVCDDCAEKAERERLRQERERKERARLADLARTFEQRVRASQLERYELDYDPARADSNPELRGWMERHWNSHSIMLTGETGLAKTRLVQWFARRWLQTVGSAYFCKAAELADELAAQFKSNPARGRKMMTELYQFELLVIDDFGKETLSDCKLSKIFDLIDKRYEQHDKIIHGRTPFYGARLWITTNDSAMRTLERMQDYGLPALRRLRDMCAIWPDRND